MSKTARHFHQERRSVEYLEYESALLDFGGFDDLTQNPSRGDLRLEVFAADGTRVHSVELPSSPRDGLTLLAQATRALGEEIRDRRELHEDAVSQAVFVYASCEGMDATQDFEGAVRRLVGGLREKCASEGWDFEEMSGDPDAGRAP